MNKRKNAFNVALILSLVVSSNAFGMNFQGISANAPAVHQTMLARLYGQAINNGKAGLQAIQDYANRGWIVVKNGANYAFEKVKQNPGKSITTVIVTVVSGALAYKVVEAVKTVNKIKDQARIQTDADLPLIAPAIEEYDAYLATSKPSNYTDRINSMVVIGYDHKNECPIYGQKEVQPVDVTKNKKKTEKTVTETTKVCTKDSCKPCQDKKDCKTCNKSKGCTSCVAKVVAIQVVSQNSLNHRAFNKARLLALKK